MCDNINNYYPFEIKEVDPDLNPDLIYKFHEVGPTFIRVGPKGYFFLKSFQEQAALYYNMPLRPSDIFVSTFPRSGTTWTQELVWLIANDLDYQKAANLALPQRFPLLELSFILRRTVIKEMKDDFKGNAAVQNTIDTLVSNCMSVTERLRDAPSPRFIKTHLPLSLLPPALADTARVVYVARDPRDVAVSFYHLYKLYRVFAFSGDFKTYWNYFIKDFIFYTPYFEHVKEAWEKRNHANVLFLFYEELSKDMPKTIRKVAKFLDKPITDEQVTKLSEHLKMENFKKNEAVNGDFYKDIGFFMPGEKFIRRGKVGGWRDYFDEEMTKQAERWISDNLRGTDLRFPSMDDE